MSAPTPASGLTPPDAAPAPRGRGTKGPRRPGDRIFASLATSAGVLILVVLAAVAAFLFIEGYPAFTADGEDLPGNEGFLRYVWPLVYGTLLAALLALLFAMPLSIGIALYISHYAPRTVARSLGYLIDLLAAIPSVVYGLWGVTVLAPYLVPHYQWLEVHLGVIPFFDGPASVTGRTILTGALVLAVMILPIMTAINREVFLQTPSLHEEAALALGATRWEMIRMTVLPYGRSGIVSAAMLGLGRAIGETIALLLIVSLSGVVTLDLISSVNPSTIAANIAADFPEASGLSLDVLIASGLVLFVITFAVNYVARFALARRSEFDGAAG